MSDMKKTVYQLNRVTSLTLFLIPVTPCFATHIGSCGR